MANTDIFLGSGASLTFVPETRLYIPLASASSDVVSVHSDYDGLRLVDKLYIGCHGEYYNTSNVLQGTFVVTNNELDGTTQKITISPAITFASGDYLLLDAYGTPCPAPRNGDYCRLNSDNWLGLVESASFPTTEVEMKQTNLSLGGSRNFTYQYKGIETASGGNLSLVANHAAWLYYFFGKCSSIAFNNGSGAALDGATISNQMGSGAVDGKFMIETASGNGTDTSTTSFVDDGPIFYRGITSPSAGTSPMLIPPVPPNLVTLANLDEVNAITETGGAIDLPITYTFTEANNHSIPSFSIEQSFSKLSASNPYRSEATGSSDEDLNFVKIARGNRVNTMTITANENEEIKLSMDLNTRQVFSFAQADKYESRRAVEDETSFINYGEPTFREPFFFSSGSFKSFGQTFLKVSSLTLTMNNNLTDKRYVGIGNKSIQNSIPAQRTYEVSFTGYVSDDKLYTELLNEDENNDSSAGNMLELNFTKDNGEEFTLKFTDYMVSSNNFPIPDDKGPIEVETTIMPRNLNSCTVKTHWILQG